MRVVMGWLFVGILSGASCDRRPEEPLFHGPAPVATPSSAPAATPTESEVGEPAASSPADAGNAASPCLVPSPEEPPPSAKAAKNCPPDDIPGGLALPKEPMTFPEAPGEPTLAVEMARTNRERMRGLMFRTKLDADGGMLFDFPGTPTVRSFWMRNTCIPLDMLFITDDGFIAGILENVPTLNEESRSIPCPVRYVLEVNAGWTRAHGVRAGQRAKLPGQ